MVSLTIVAAALGLVTFGNAEPALRYFKSSPPERALQGKEITITLTGKGCDGLILPENLKNFRLNCKTIEQRKTVDCQDLYNKALQDIIKDVVTSPDTYDLVEPRDKVSQFCQNYPVNPTKEEKISALHAMYVALPHSEYYKDGKLQQSTFGIKGKHPYFLARLALYISKTCYIVKKK